MYSGSTVFEAITTAGAIGESQQTANETVGPAPCLSISAAVILVKKVHLALSGAKRNEYSLYRRMRNSLPSPYTNTVPNRSTDRIAW